MKAVIRAPAAVAVLLCLAMAACFVPAPAAAQEGPVLYVVADVVKLRDGPSRDAAVVANLRIDTAVRPVEGEAVPEGWARVASVDGNEAGPFVTGYVASAFLSEERPTAAALLDRHRAQMAAGDLEAARTTAERLVALEPADRRHVERLSAIHERLGDEGGATRLTAYLRGEGVKYLAYCTGDSAILLVEYRPGQGLSTWAGWPNDRGPRGYVDTGELARLALELQRSPWFGFPRDDRDTAGRSFELAGTWLLNARLVPPPNRDETGDKDVERILPGNCPRRGLVYSNEPMRAIETGRVDWATANDFIGAVTAPVEYAVEGVRAWRIVEGRGLMSIQIDVERANLWSIGSEDFIWGLIDGEDNQRLTRIGSYDRADRFILASRVVWFKWELSPQRVAIVEYYVQTDGGGAGNRIGIFVVDENNVVTHQEIILTFVQTM